MGNGHGFDLALLMLRVAGGGFLLPHALGKLFGWFGGPGLAGFAGELRGFGLPAVAPLPLLLALLQVASGLAVLLGWQTRIAALAAAAFIAFTALLALPKGWFWMAWPCLETLHEFLPPRPRPTQRRAGQRRRDGAGAGRRCRGGHRNPSQGAPHEHAGHQKRPRHHP